MQMLAIETLIRRIVQNRALLAMSVGNSRYKSGLTLMILRAISIKGFRSFQDVSITFDSDITTFVGENNVGKSTLWHAIQGALFSTGFGGVTDYPYGVIGPVSMQIEIELSDPELRNSVIQPFVASVMQGRVDRGSGIMLSLHDSLQHLGRRISIQIDQPNHMQQPVMKWGRLVFSGQLMLYSNSAAFLQEIAMAGRGSLPVEALVDWNRFATDRGPFLLPLHFSGLITELVRPLLKYMTEFRADAIAGQRSSNIETMIGNDTASVLLNLKNHSARTERERYKSIVSAFTKLFLRYETIEAIETAPSNGQADIQFWEKARDTPLTLGQVSAGVKQILTLLTTLIGRQDLVLFLEHPEQHLHPHGMRYLHSLLVEASARNQIIIVTHDPHFISSSHLVGLHRVWWTPDRGTEVFGLDLGSEDKEDRSRLVRNAQFRTVLRHLGNRELVFARAVVLAEDESQQEFLIAVSDTLGHNLNAHGISVLPVGGQSGYPPFIALLRALAVPFICLKDLPWGDDQRYPPDLFFSLGMEIEAYLDEHGLTEARQAMQSRHGGSKRRVAYLLGTELGKDQIPVLFDTFLAKAVALATGEPAITEQRDSSHID